MPPIARVLLCGLLLASSDWGTLIVQAPTKDGIVICADMRRTAVGTKKSALSSRDAPKLVKVNNDCVFYVSGTQIWSWGEGKITKGHIDFARLTEQWLRVHSYKNLGKDVPRIEDYYKLQFTKFLRSTPKNSRPQVTFDSGGQPVFAVIGIVFRVGQQLTAKEFSVLYRSSDPINIDVVEEDHTRDVRTLGEANVFVELLSGRRPDFDGFRGEPVMRQVLPEMAAGKYETLPADIVWAFAKRTIVLTSEHPLPGMTPNSVSSNSQCLVLTPNQGITRSEL